MTAKPERCLLCDGWGLLFSSAVTVERECPACEGWGLRDAMAPPGTLAALRVRDQIVAKIERIEATL